MRTNKMKQLSAAFFIVLFFLFIGSANAADKPKSVILVISDGTGISQLTSLRYTTDDFQFFRFPTVGLFTTHALDKLVTDSAAGGTAFSTGHKTNNGMVAVLPDGTKLKTVLELAEEQGKATGLVATSQITHATPACFSAHVEKRSNEMEIARQQAAAGIEVLLGGGAKFYETNDEGNLVTQMTKSGYAYVNEKEQLEQLETESSEKVLGLFAESGMKQATEREIPLSLMSQKAVEVLDNDSDGFFLMIESSQVDWRGHANDADGLVAEMQDMNAAMKWLLDYQESHPDVLLVWVSDHETGGLAIGYGSSVEEKKIEADWTSEGHTGQMIPAFSIGPGASEFAGVYDNTDVGKRLLKFFK